MTNVIKVFIIGASRSGTTLLSDILGRHDEIIKLPELHFFDNIISSNDGPAKMIKKSTAIKTSARLLATLNRGYWEEVIKEDYDYAKTLFSDSAAGINSIDVLTKILNTYVSSKGYTICVEHTGHNIYYRDLIEEKIPDSKLIYIIRDPRAVLYSQKRRWRKKFKGDNVPWKEVIRNLINYNPISQSIIWKQQASLIRNDLIKRKNIVFVRYEDLVLHPEVTIRGLCQKLNICYKADMLNVTRYSSSHEHLGNSNGGIRKESLELWRTGLSEAEIAISDRINKNLLNFFKYPRCNTRIVSFSLICIVLLSPIVMLLQVLFNMKLILNYLKLNK